MSRNDPFWKLSDLDVITTQYEFFEQLQASDTLENVLYSPQVLKKEDQKTTRIESKTFTCSSFSHTRIVGIIFRDCHFENCLFIGAVFEDCEFHSCSFKSTNTQKVSFKSTYVNPHSFLQCLDKRKHQNIGVHLFKELQRNSRDEGQGKFERDAKFLFSQWERYQGWYDLRQEVKKFRGRPKAIWELLKGMTKRLVSCCWGWIWEVVSGSGVRIMRFLRFVAIVILLFSAINYSCMEHFGLKSAQGAMTSYVEALYFTVISLTTLGYGDFTPGTDVGQLWASFQSVIGFVLFALLTSMIFRRLFS